MDKKSVMKLKNQDDSLIKEIGDSDSTEVNSQSDMPSMIGSNAKPSIEEEERDTKIQSANDNESEAERKHLIQWQNRLLPLMSLLLISLTIFFLLASIFQLYGVQANIMLEQKPDLDNELKSLSAVEGDLPRNSFEKARLAALIKLETNSVQRRYHQAATATLARVWTIYLGFLTGMILSLMGAVFILGKLRESVSRVNIENQGLKTALESSSPGIILVFLGTVLMIVTMLARADVSVEDRPLYITGIGEIAKDADKSDSSTNESNSNTNDNTKNDNSSSKHTNSNSNLERHLQEGKSHLDNISVSPTQK